MTSPEATSAEISAKPTSHRVLILTLAAVIVGFSAPAVLLIDAFWTLATLSSSGTVPIPVPYPAIVVWLVLGVAAALYFAVIAINPLRRVRDIALQLSMTTLVALAPAAFVILSQFSRSPCSPSHFLGMPWPDAIAALAQILSGLVIIGSLAGIVMGYLVKRFNFTAIALTAYSAAMILPVLLLSGGFGDPAPACYAG